MQKIFRRFGIIFLACMMLLGVSVTAFAAGNNNYIYTQSHRLTTNDSEWQTIATSQNGFDCWVRITNNNAYANTYTSIRMLGKNGEKVWEKTDAIPGFNYADFKCGSDVYTIQVKNVYGDGHAWIRYLKEI